MANTKGKIIIISGLILVTGITTAIVVSHFRKKRILKIIYEKLNDKSRLMALENLSRVDKVI